MPYLYRHIRKDTNEPFYIGIGSSPNYKRAFSKRERTKLWKFIVAKTDYKVEIILDDLTWKEVCLKEIEFINIYGRKDLGKGSLVNLTNGGEGAFGRTVSSKTKLKISNSVKENSHWKDGRKHTSDAISKITLAASTKVINILTSEIYNSIAEAAASIKMRPNTLVRKLSGLRINNTNFKYYM